LAVRTHGCTIGAVPRSEVVGVIRRLISRIKERRDARRARKLETAKRRAEEGYDEPPMGFSPGS
jgi:hypothetical protein